MKKYFLIKTEILLKMWSVKRTFHQMMVCLVKL